MSVAKLFRSLTVVLVPIVAGCGKSDGGTGETEPSPSATLLADAQAAMDSILTQFSPSVGYHEAMSHWGILAPGGEKLEWTSDTAANAADFAVVIPAQELIDAGVDPVKLVAAGWLYNEAMSEPHPTPAVLIQPFDLDAKSAGPDANGDSASKAFARILNRFEDRLGFHEEMEHYGIKLTTGGAKIEWTQDVEMGDADLAFVLEAAPIIAAGGDPAVLEATGWMYVEASSDPATAALLIRPIKLD